jgi:hypothetical protein
MSVKLVKLVTGEEVVCDLTVFDNLYKMKNSARIILSPDGVGMMPLCPFGKEDILEVDKKHVVFTTEPELELVNAYNSKFGSGIEIASANDLRIIASD